MRNKDIYVGALQLLSQRADVEETADYEERAPYLIATFASEAARLDAAYRKAHDVEPGSAVHPVYASLGDLFACCDRFAPAACAYLASMLVIDEDPDLSDRLFDRYSDLMAGICCEVPAQIEPILQRY